MLLIFCAVHDTVRVPLRLYRERFPNRRLPNHKLFYRFQRQLCENGSFITSTDGTGRSMTVRQTDLEEVTLDYV
ncbi:hypothetical protein TNCV_2573031 [Trichonephila clavipes]|nr:hypothetical protein TNCV_2573031 [Trichonephila clavipes]